MHYRLAWAIMLDDAGFASLAHIGYRRHRHFARAAANFAFNTARREITERSLISR